LGGVGRPPAAPALAGGGAGAALFLFSGLIDLIAFAGLRFGARSPRKQSLASAWNI
jgi:hypothetical protein